MKNRRDFIRNTLLALTASVLPKVLMPSIMTVRDRKDGDTSYAIGFDPYATPGIVGESTVYIKRSISCDGKLVAEYWSEKKTDDAMRKWHNEFNYQFCKNAE